METVKNPVVKPTFKQSNKPKQFKKNDNNETDQQKLDRWGEIELKFGKYKGLTLNELIKTDQNYFKWLANEMKEAPKDKKTPTSKAIIKFYDLYILNDCENDFLD